MIVHIPDSVVEIGKVEYLENKVESNEKIVSEYDDLVIVTTEGSYAQAYAEAKFYKYAFEGNMKEIFKPMWVPDNE